VASAAAQPVASFQLVVKGPVEGMTVRIDGAAAGMTPFVATLPRGVHTVELEHPDWASWKDAVNPNNSGVTEINPRIERSISWQRGQLLDQRQGLEAKLGLVKGPHDALAGIGAVGWITAALGAAGAVTGVLLGQSARAEYDAATTAAAASAARKRAETFNLAFQIGVFGGGGGLLTGLVTAIFMPDTTRLERDIKTVDTKLKNLEAQK
jgi:hypothetical protein